MANETDTGTVTGPASAPETAQPSSNASIESIVDAEISRQDTAEKPPETPARPADAPGKQAEQPLIFGKYRTLEDAEKAHKDLERHFHEQRTAEKQRQEEAAKANEKQPLPDLSPEELQQLKEEDPDIHAKYVEAKNAERAEALVEKKLKPITEALDPLIEERKRLEAERFEVSQKAYFEDTKKFFGQEYEGLIKQQRDQAIVNRVLQESPAAEQMIQLAESGRKAEAHRLLLREIQYMNMREASQKRAKSVPVDVPAANTVRNTGKPKSIEDAFNLAVEEHSAKN